MIEIKEPKDVEKLAGHYILKAGASSNGFWLELSGSIDEPNIMFEVTTSIKQNIAKELDSIVNTTSSLLLIKVKEVSHEQDTETQ